MAYKLVIFDLDGTLVDTIADLGAAVNVALEKTRITAWVPPNTPRWISPTPWRR